MFIVQAEKFDNFLKYFHIFFYFWDIPLLINIHKPKETCQAIPLIINIHKSEASNQIDSYRLDQKFLRIIHIAFQIQCQIIEQIRLAGIYFCVVYTVQQKQSNYINFYRLRLTLGGSCIRKFQKLFYIKHLLIYLAILKKFNIFT